MWFRRGASGSSSSGLRGWKSVIVRVAPGLFPPELAVLLVASISGSTLWRRLHQDGIRPCYHRSWIFHKDPDFAEKAGQLLDLYSRQWEDKPLKTDEFVISADEKTSIQAHRRLHPTEPCKPGRAAHVENRYKRGGAWFTSALWTSTMPEFLAGVKPKTASRHLVGWSNR